MAKRNLPKPQTYTRGLPPCTRIVQKDPDGYYGKHSTLFYYPEYATGLFSTGWEPYHDAKGGPMRFDSYPEAKAFLEEACANPQTKQIQDRLQDPKSAIRLKRS